MRISASICFLASVVATLVLVTTSLPQSSRDLFSHMRPKGCKRIGYTKYQHDVDELNLVKRDPQLSGIHALEARVPPLPCGAVVGGGQSHFFRLARSVSHLQLVWAAAATGVEFTTQIIRIYLVNPKGPDTVVEKISASDFHSLYFRPLKDGLYYLTLTGLPDVLMRFYFTRW